MDHFRTFIYKSLKVRKQEKGALFYVDQDTDAGGFLRRDAGNRLLLPEECHGCQGICAGRTERRAVADGFCIRNLLLLGCHFRGICRTVWLEIRYFLHMGRHWKRFAGLPAGLGGARTPNPDYDPAPEQRDDAGFFRKAVWQRGAEGGGFHRDLHFPDSLYGFPV